MVFAAITFFFDLLDNSTYFGFSHARSIRMLAFAIWGPAAIGIGTALWRYAALGSVGPARRFFFSVYGACMVGAMIAVAVSTFATLIDHQVLFPAATTKTLTRVEAPIGEAFATHGKGHGWFITLPPLGKPLRITESRYKVMMAERKRIEPALDPDHFTVAGAFCARLTLQLSGPSGRILKTSELAVSSTIHPCPPGYDDVFARLPADDGLAR